MFRSRGIKFGVLLLVLVLGAARLRYPFGGDQALFDLGGWQMLHGQVLYRDLWDCKQPGIFVFYLIGGALFGFHEAGIHLFELCYLLGFSLVLQRTLRGHSPSAALAPLLTIGAYYAATGAWHLTQLEILVAPPLYLALVLPLHSERPASLLLAGAMGGLAVLFKQMFLPLVLGFFCLALLRAAAEGEEMRRLGRHLSWLVLGFLAPLGLTLAWFAWHKELGLLLWTWFIFPPRLLAMVRTTSPDRLTNALCWFIGHFSVPVALGWLGLLGLRGRPPGGRHLPRPGLLDVLRQDALVLGLLWWCLGGLAVIVVQRQSWWQYHFLLLVVPVGVLATLGVDWLLRILGDGGPVGWRTGAWLGLGLLVLWTPELREVAADLRFMLRRDRPDAALPQPRTGRSRDYQRIREEVAFLREPGSLPGPIYVFGSPLYYYLSGRQPASPLNAWSSEFWLPEQRAWLDRSLVAAPPPYVYVSREYVDPAPADEADMPQMRLAEGTPLMAELLAKHYQVLRSDPSGTFYMRLP